jgi:hypothetical protein
MMDIFPFEQGFVSFVDAKGPRKGEFGFLKYLGYLLESGHLKPRSLLLFDGEKSFMTPKVQQFLMKNSIFHDVIRPSELHQLLSPCDNHFHSTFKSKYYAEISQRSISYLSTISKLKLAKQCYESVSTESIISMFRKCGLLGGDFRSTVSNLVNEGLHYLGGNDRKIQRKNLTLYIEWCKANNLEDIYLRNYQNCKEHITEFLSPSRAH